jgi:RNA polymerase sigma-70 factor (ECF subfamily)
MEATDEALLESWRSGDSTSGEALFERHYVIIERFFLNKVPNAVQDLVQETFTRCLSSRTRIRDNKHFVAYLIGIAKNVLHAHLRERYRDHQPLDLEQASVCDLQTGPGTLVGRRREHRLLLEALRNIPVDDQMILELHYWEDLKTEEIADALDIPVGTARGRLQRARAKLEEVMQRLAESSNELDSTVARLEDWAKECRAHLDSYLGSGK